MSKNGDAPNRNSSDTLTGLMRTMGSISGEFDPLPPTQHEALADFSEPNHIRVLGVILGRTIHRGNDGQRSAFAREANGHPSGVSHIAAALDMTPSRVTEAIQLLETQGKVRIEKKPFRVYLRADVPAARISGEAKKKGNVFPSTWKISQTENDFLVRLHEENPQGFKVAVGRIVAVERWSDTLEADAMAWARERVSEQRRNIFTELGYTHEEKRGNKRIRSRGSAEAFQPAQDFEKFHVHHSVEIEKAASQFHVLDGKVIPYTVDSNCVQTSHPYRPEASETENQLACQGRVDAGQRAGRNPLPNAGSIRGTGKRGAEAKAEAEEKQKVDELKSEVIETLRRARLSTLGAVLMDAGTLTTIARHLARLRTVGDVKEVLETLEVRARELAKGERAANGWGYLVNVVKSECDDKLNAVQKQLKAAAARMGM